MQVSLSQQPILYGNDMEPTTCFNRIFLGCEEGNCYDGGRYSCKIYTVQYDSLDLEPTNNEYAAWGTSKTCNNDGQLCSSFNLVYNFYITVCESYQKQFEIEAKETEKRAALVDNELEDGINYCIKECETTHYDSCVGVEIEMTVNYHM